MHENGLALAGMCDDVLHDSLARLAAPVVGIDIPEPYTHVLGGIGLADLAADGPIRWPPVVRDHARLAELTLDLARAQRGQVRVRDRVVEDVVSVLAGKRSVELAGLDTVTGREQHQRDIHLLSGDGGALEGLE